MKRPSRAATTATLAMLAGSVSAALTGCVSLLPRSPPVQLYRFGFMQPTSPAAAAQVFSGRPMLLTLGAVTLPRAAAGDAILTRTGDAVAYVGRARWVSPAVVLLQEAAEQAFAAPSGVKLLRRTGGVGSTAGELALEGRRFETVYRFPGAAPVVHVSVHAVLSAPGGDGVADETFTVEQPAARDTVGAIVAAYDLAVSAVLDRAAQWTVRIETAPQR